jgi:ferric-dicitrate binding protein FerR (iron transport regulator)
MGKNDLMEKIWLKSIIGITNKQEEESLNEWLNDNPDTIENWKIKWGGKAREIKDYDSHAAWTKINNRAPLRKKSITKLIPWFSAAALLLVIIGYFFISNDVSKNEFVSSGKNMIITLPDKSKVTLIGKSKILYDENFGKEDRIVAIEGKAFFDIERDTTKKFIVMDDKYKVEVLGTSYLIDETRKSIDVHVATGIVKVSVDNDSDVLTMGQAISIRDGALHRMEKIDESILESFTGNFQFRNEKLANVLSRINTYYNNVFIFQGNIDRNECRLNTKMGNLPVSEVAEIISLACNLKLEKTNGQFILSEKINR